VQRYTAAYLYFATTRAQAWTSCGPPTLAAENPIDCVYKYKSSAQVLEVPGIRWLSEKSECNWVGVTCNSRGEIFKIELCTFLLPAFFSPSCCIHLCRASKTNLLTPQTHLI
jgi:hypothetical protein